MPFNEFRFLNGGSGPADASVNIVDAAGVVTPLTAMAVPAMSAASAAPAALLPGIVEIQAATMVVAGVPLTIQGLPLYLAWGAAEFVRAFMVLSEPVPGDGQPPGSALTWAFLVVEDDLGRFYRREFI